MTYSASEVAELFTEIYKARACVSQIVCFNFRQRRKCPTAKQQVQLETSKEGILQQVYFKCLAFLDVYCLKVYWTHVLCRPVWTEGNVVRDQISRANICSWFALVSCQMMSKQKQTGTERCIVGLRNNTCIIMAWCEQRCTTVFVNGYAFWPAISLLFFLSFRFFLLFFFCVCVCVLGPGGRGGGGGGEGFNVLFLPSPNITLAEAVLLLLPPPPPSTHTSPPPPPPVFFLLWTTLWSVWWHTDISLVMWFYDLKALPYGTVICHFYMLVLMSMLCLQIHGLSLNISREQQKESVLQKLEKAHIYQSKKKIASEIFFYDSILFFFKQMSLDAVCTVK